MSDCCEHEAEALQALRGRQATALWIVLIANLAMFVVEFCAGLWSGSSALQADSLDMLGDSLVYGFSLHVLHRSMVWRSRAAFVKGLLMAGFGIGVLVDAALSARLAAPPVAPAMAGFATLALGVNALSFALLYRHRGDDINLHSTWLCTRNDLAANIAVIGAAFAVAYTGSGWPDLVVGVAIAALFLRTSLGVLRRSIGELWGAAPAAEPARSR